MVMTIFGRFRGGGDRPQAALAGGGERGAGRRLQDVLARGQRQARHAEQARPATARRWFSFSFDASRGGWVARAGERGKERLSLRCRSCGRDADALCVVAAQSSELAVMERARLSDRKRPRRSHLVTRGPGGGGARGAAPWEFTPCRRFKLRSFFFGAGGSAPA